MMSLAKKSVRRSLTSGRSVKAFELLQALRHTGGPLVQVKALAGAQIVADDRIGPTRARITSKPTSKVNS
jgi:hypothetical protein